MRSRVTVRNLMRVTVSSTGEDEGRRLRVRVEGDSERKGQGQGEVVGDSEIEGQDS